MSPWVSPSTRASRKAPGPCGNYYKPFVDWIWGGCLLMSLGGLIAIADRRYRVKARAATPTAAACRGLNEPDTTMNSSSGPSSVSSSWWCCWPSASTLNPREVPSPPVASSPRPRPCRCLDNPAKTSPPRR